MKEYTGTKCAYCGNLVDSERDRAHVMITNVSVRENATATIDWDFFVCQECMMNILPKCFKGEVQ